MARAQSTARPSLSVATTRAAGLASRRAAATAPVGTYAVDPTTIVNGVYNAIFATYPPAFAGFETNAAFIAGGFWQLAAQGGLFTTTFFPVLVQLLARDPADFLVPVGASFTALLNANTVTQADLITALSGAGITGTTAIVALAATIDATTLGAGISANITAQNQVYGAITQVVSLQLFAATTVDDEDAALQGDIAALASSGLPPAQIVGALAALYGHASGFPAGATLQTAFTNLITTGLVTPGHIAEPDVYTVVGQTYQAIGFADTPSPCCVSRPAISTSAIPRSSHASNMRNWTNS